MDLAKDIAAIVKQGSDPSRYIGALARMYSIPEAAVATAIQDVIAQTGKPPSLHPEDVAQARLRADRQEARQYRREYLRSEHEED